MRGLAALLSVLFGVFGVIPFVLVSVAGMAVSGAFVYLGQPLLIIPSLISGIDIAKGSLSTVV